MSIKLVFANVGTGKTTYLAKLAHSKRNIKKYDKIFSNVPIEGCYQFDVRDLGKLHIENALLLIDEGAIVLDNNVKLPEREKTFYRLHRHYNCDIVVVSQSFEDINIVVRRLYTSMYIMKRSLFFPWLSYTRLISKKIGIDEVSKQIIDFYDFIPFSRRYFRRSKYYKYFDSYDKPQLQEFEPKLWIEPKEEEPKEKVTVKDKLLAIKDKAVNTKITIPFIKPKEVEEEGEVICQQE